VVAVPGFVAVPGSVVVSGSVVVPGAVAVHSSVVVHGSIAIAASALAVDAPARAAERELIAPQSSTVVTAGRPAPVVGESPGLVARRRGGLA
jgi:hypothetical protein